jgi:hypothetical protein
MAIGCNQNNVAPRRPAKAATPKAPLVTVEAALEEAVDEAAAEVRDPLATEEAELGKCKRKLRQSQIEPTEKPKTQRPRQTRRQQSCFRQQQSCFQRQ